MRYLRHEPTPKSVLVFIHDRSILSFKIWFLTKSVQLSLISDGAVVKVTHPEDNLLILKSHAFGKNTYYIVNY